MNDQELLRYSRQILLPEFGVEGQERLRSARVLIIGLGGLGSPVAMYLAAAGVGDIVLCDFDQVDLSNLQRQVVHGQADIGRPKAESARDRLRLLNPQVRTSTVTHVLEGSELEGYVGEANVVVDASDNFATRFRLNEACVRLAKPLVFGAAIRLEGQLSVFNLRPGRSPCYRCLYGHSGELDETCSQTGVMAPVVGIIGSLQALEAIKVITGLGEPLDGRLLLLDAKLMEWHSVALARNPACEVCAGGAHA